MPRLWSGYAEISSVSGQGIVFGWRLSHYHSVPSYPERFKKMKKISFDTKNGYLLLDGIMMAPLDESEFIKIAKENDIKIEDNKTNTYVHNLSTCGSLNEFEFGINFTFKNYCMKSVWLSWDGGNTKKYGYKTTEKQLISDKNSLTKLLAEVLGKDPDEIKKTFSASNFPWGNISASASIQSAMTSIGISWNCGIQTNKD
jgi:hypothetical protein